MRRRSVMVLVPATAVLVAAAAATPASAAPFVARLKAPTHHPKVGTPWTITVTARSNGGTRLHATAVYKFVYHGQTVATQYPSPHHPGEGRRPYAFFGSYRDPIPWPARSAGFALTFRVVVTVKGLGSRNLDYAVRVRR